MTAETPFKTHLPDEPEAFFRILVTTQRSQTGFMDIPPDTEAGAPETHANADQVFYIVHGRAQVRTWDDGPRNEPEQHTLEPGGVLVVPAGVQHWVKSLGPGPMRFFTVYAPAEY